MSFTKDAVKKLADIGEIELVERLAKALAMVYSKLDVKGLARDAGMAPLTLKTGLDAAFGRFSVDGVHSIIEAVRKAYRAFGAAGWTTPKNLFAIIGGRLPDPALTVVVTAMAMRIPLVIKPPTAHPAFVKALVSGLQRADQLFGRCVEVLNRPGNDPDTQSLVKDAASAMVFGDDRTVMNIRAARSGRPTMGFGHREAVEIIMDSCTDEVFWAIARDICMYDQAGCLSPHIIAVKQGIMPLDAFAGNLYHALILMKKKLPQGPVSFNDAAITRIFIQELIRQGGRLADNSLLPNVAFNVPRPFRTGPGNRFVQVMDFMDMDDLFELLGPLSGHVQAFAVHPDPKALVPLLQQHPDLAGWLTHPGTLQSPPVLWPEDGRFMAFDLTSPLKIS